MHFCSRLLRCLACIFNLITGPCAQGKAQHTQVWCNRLGKKSPMDGGGGMPAELSRLCCSLHPHPLSQASPTCRSRPQSGEGREISNSLSDLNARPSAGSERAVTTARITSFVIMNQQPTCGAPAMWGALGSCTSRGGRSRDQNGHDQRLRRSKQVRRPAEAQQLTAAQAGATPGSA